MENIRETEAETEAEATVYVDPSCPFAWITSSWLREVADQTGIAARHELMSLSVVNEGRELEEWYRDYNERAWRPARVAAAVHAATDDKTWGDFYRVFGQRRHVEGLRDDAQNIKLTLTELGLPAELGGAAEDPAWDEDLRRRTATATQRVGGDVGTPILHVAGKGFFGPVLTSVPRKEAAVQLWQAVKTLATEPAFSEIKGARDERLQTV
jgi:hypothetical protein